MSKHQGRLPSWPLLVRAMSTISASDMQLLLDRMADIQKQNTEQFADRFAVKMMEYQTQTTNKYHEQLIQMTQDKEKESMGKTRPKESMTGRRAFTSLPTYSGKPEEFDLWRFQLIQFLSAEPAFPAMIHWVETEGNVKEEFHGEKRKDQEDWRRKELERIPPEEKEQRKKYEEEYPKDMG